ncbi:MAG: response regulator transcription factor [Bermanella sp.]
MAINIILADDHQLFREGIKTLLEAVAGYTVVAEVDNAISLKETIKTVSADLVLLDYRMPGGGALTTLTEIKKKFPKTKVIALTGVDSSSLFKQLINSSADGVLHKEISADELLQAVSDVLKGKKAYSARVKEQAIDQKPILSNREYQVLDLVVEGLNNNEIGERLNLSAKTIENHRYNLMNKLEVRNVVELMHYARKNGLFHD